MENGEKICNAQGCVQRSTRSSRLYINGEHGACWVIVITNRRIRSRTYGGVRGRESRMTPSYLIILKGGKEVFLAIIL